MTEGPELLAGLPGVSRETMVRLSAYAALLERWQARINLVGPATLPQLWRRHMLDSAQLYRLLPRGARVLVDLGSGAGFPGLVLAAMGGPEMHPLEVHLIESDTRKCAFLREAARVMDVGVVVHHQRIEQVPAFPADVVTARALAPLGVLIGHATAFLRPGDNGDSGECLFLKGRGAEDELTLAAKEWKMAIERIPSLSDPEGLVLRVSEVERGRTHR